MYNLNHTLTLGDVELRLFPTVSTHPLMLDLAARQRHVHIVGQTGTGKSTLLANMIAQDLALGHGVAVIDPHGSLAEAALGHVPPDRVDQVIYFDPSDLDHPLGFNVLAGASAATAPLIAENTLSAFLHIWSETAIGPASRDLLSNALRALMDAPAPTLLGVLRMIDDEDYRRGIARRVGDPVIRHYWCDTVPQYSARAWEEITRPISNKLRAVLSNPRARNIVGQSSSSFDLRRVMDTSQIFIANIAIGRLGETVTRLIGALLSSALATTAFGRVDMSEAERVPFHLYVDEFQLFSSSAFATILSQSRKFGLTLTLAHQYLSQLPDDLRSAVLGTTGTTIAYRLGAEDARLLSQHLGLDERYRDGQFKGSEQLMTLPERQAFVRMIEDGEPALHALSPYAPTPAVNRRPHRIVANSRAQFARPRARIEAGIDAFYTRRR